MSGHIRPDTSRLVHPPTLAISHSNDVAGRSADFRGKAELDEVATAETRIKRHLAHHEIRGREVGHLFRCFEFGFGQDEATVFALEFIDS